MSDESQTETYEPKVVAFCCTYCAYTAGDLAGSMRLEYSPNIRVVKVLCSGKMDAVLLLRAFEDGADAVYVAGCALGDCHFLEGNLRALRTVADTKRLLKEIGLEPERLEFFHIPASAGPLFAERANEMAARAKSWDRTRCERRWPKTQVVSSPEMLMNIRRFPKPNWAG